jgi:GTPase SAR1 family protein
VSFFFHLAYSGSFSFDPHSICIIFFTFSINRDTGGQERFGNATSSFYRGALGVMFVFDIAEDGALKKLQSMFEDQRKKRTTTNGFICWL